MAHKPWLNKLQWLLFDLLQAQKIYWIDQFQFQISFSLPFESIVWSKLFEQFEGCERAENTRWKSFPIEKPRGGSFCKFEMDFPARDFRRGAKLKKHLNAFVKCFLRYLNCFLVKLLIKCFFKFAPPLFYCWYFARVVKYVRWTPWTPFNNSVLLLLQYLANNMSHKNKNIMVSCLQWSNSLKKYVKTELSTQCDISTPAVLCVPN